MLTRIRSNDYPRATTIVFKQEYSITLTMGGLGQMSRRDARCLPKMIYVSPFSPYFWINVFFCENIKLRICQRCQMSTSNSYRTTSTVFNLIKRYKCWCNDINDAILTGNVGHDTCLTIMKSYILEFSGALNKIVNKYTCKKIYFKNSGKWMNDENMILS